MRTVNVDSIGEYIRQQREQARISLRQLAQAAGVSNPYLSQIERGLRRPSAEILQQIAKGLRISAEALYVQAGILEDRPSDSGVRSAVLTDPGLSERQKQILLEIYESFRTEFASLRAQLNGTPVPDDEAGAGGGQAEPADDAPAALAAGAAEGAGGAPGGIAAGPAAEAQAEGGPASAAPPMRARPRGQARPDPPSAEQFPTSPASG